jgi:hypothetical protein
MTTSTDTQPLAVGDRVSFRGALATVVEVEEHEHRNGSEHALRLLKYDDGQNLSDGYSWGDSDRGPGRYWWVTPDNANIERVAPEPYAPRLGDRVTVPTDGDSRAQGRIYATYSTPVSEVWVGSAEGSDSFCYPWSEVRADGPWERYSDVPEGTRGRWFGVSSVQPDTSEEAPSEAAEASAESPEMTALKAQLSAAEGRESTLKHVIQSMERDLAIIGDSLKETADRHEWCGQYEEHLEELLGKLSGYSDDILREHAERAQDYTVTVTFTTTVRATDRNDAIEQAQEGAMEYDAYMGNWDAEEE